MATLRAFRTGKGAGKRQSHYVQAVAEQFPVQAKAGFQLPSYPFQPLPEPLGAAPYRFDLSQLLSATDVAAITSAGSMVFHTVGDTGDYRGQQQDFVAAMMTADAVALPAAKKPAFFYHLGDVVYFAGDIDKYAANFYETYKNYPGFIVSIPGNHDCQPDDPQDGPVDPTKTPLDGWVQNFMSADTSQQGAPQTGSVRTIMDLPNCYWTFTTPFATIIGLFSNVGEIQGEFHADQIAWFRGELKAANPNLALIVTVHHPSYSGDTEHSGSTVVEQTLFGAFKKTKVYPDLILHGHVHNYQRFTLAKKVAKKTLQIPCIVAGAGGYTNLGTLYTINGAAPKVPLALGGGLTLEQYDQTNFGFLRFEVSKTQIIGTYLSAAYVAGAVSPVGSRVESFAIDLKKNTVSTLP